MSVVGCLELVLHYHRLARGYVPAHEVEAEPANGMLGNIERQVHSQQVAEDV